jgi:hypothetical protein
MIANFAKPKDYSSCPHPNFCTSLRLISVQYDPASRLSVRYEKLSAQRWTTMKISAVGSPVRGNRTLGCLAQETHSQATRHSGKSLEKSLAKDSESPGTASKNDFRSIKWKLARLGRAGQICAIAATPKCDSLSRPNSDSRRWTNQLDRVKFMSFAFMNANEIDEPVADGNGEVEWKWRMGVNAKMRGEF